MPPKSNFPQTKTYKSMKWSNGGFTWFDIVLQFSRERTVENPKLLFWKFQSGATHGSSLANNEHLNVSSSSGLVVVTHVPLTTCHQCSWELLIRFQTTLEWTWRTHLQLGQVRVLHQCFYASIYHIPSTLLQMHSAISYWVRRLYV